MSLNTEIAIVGGGIYGASVAFHLARLGKTDITLLDKGPLASEVSSQGAGFLATLRENESLTRLCFYSTEFYANFTAETGSPLALHQVGSVKVVYSDAYVADLQAEMAVGKRTGVEVHPLSLSDLKHLVPVLTTENFKAAYYIPFEGYVERTAQAVRGLAAGAQRLGAQVLAHTPVNRISRNTSGTFTLSTPHTDIQAETVVLATGSFSQHLAGQLGFFVPAYPVKHQCVVIATREIIPPDMPNLRLPDSHLYIRHDEGGLLIGGVESNIYSPPPGALWADLEVAHIRPDRDILEGFVTAAQDLISAARESFVVREQQAYPMVSPDLDMLLGPVPGIPHLYLANPGTLRGIQTAPGAGRLLAELIVHGEAWIDAAPWRVDRFGDRYNDPQVLRQACVTALSTGIFHKSDHA